MGERCCEFECLDDTDDWSGPDVYDAAATGTSGSQRQSVFYHLLGLVVLLMAP